MVKRKIYARPLIAEFLLDSELSLVMSSENTPDPPGGSGGSGGPEPVEGSEEGLNQSNKSRSFENNPFE
jgi:hypothetical protein